MAKIKDFKSWVTRDLSRFSHLKTHISYLQITNKEIKIKIFTNTNRYTISAKDDCTGGYLGCIASSRKPRAGEDWNRGRDLADGPLSQTTWRQILGDIISYEMVKITTSEPKLIDPD